jgi:hypothetical protein
MIFNKKIKVLCFDSIDIDKYPHFIKIVIQSNSKEKLENILKCFKKDKLIEFKIERKIFNECRLYITIKIDLPYTENEYCELIGRLFYLCGENMSSIKSVGAIL